jgi:hypothetical protein
MNHEDRLSRAVPAMAGAALWFVAISIAFVAFAAGCGSGNPTAIQPAPSPTPNPYGLGRDGRIENIERFLSRCPQSDPDYIQIRATFDLRRDGIPVGEVPCTEPTSAMTQDAYTGELALLQVMRLLYHIDLGQSGHLPWTSGSLWPWLTQIRGIHLNSNGMVAPHCCDTIGGQRYIVFHTSLNTRPSGVDILGGLMATVVHERRHADGRQYNHSCGPTNDLDYDERDLSAFGVQYWIYRALLTGQLQTGYGCSARWPAYANSWKGNANIFAMAFCRVQAPLLEVPTMPPACAPGAAGLVAVPEVAEIEPSAFANDVNLGLAGCGGPFGGDRRDPPGESLHRVFPAN